MKNNKPKIYFISNSDDIKNQFEDKKTHLTSIINQDPLYIINLDLLQESESIKLTKIYTQNNDFEFIFAENNWIPLRFPCELKNNNCNECPLKDFYKEDKKICTLKKQPTEISLIQNSFKKLKLGKNQENDNLIHYLKKHLCNTAGMYFFAEPKKIEGLKNHIEQIKNHYNKVSALKLRNNINSFYKTAFNRMDYGVSIISSDDRTIVYTNRARRKHFGADNWKKML